MELVDGQPLSALIRPGQPLDPDVTRDLMAQAADAIGAAHAAGIVHRDVKPANLLVTPDRRVKITDFGIARATEGMALTQTGQVMGTPQYLSPEQAQGGTATPASDVYSLGVVTFECLTSRRPFVGETPVATALAHLREPVPPLPAERPRRPRRRGHPLAGQGPRRALRRRHRLRRRAARPVRRRARHGGRRRPRADATQVMPPGVAPVPPPATTTSPVRPPTARQRSVPWLWVVLAVVVAGRDHRADRRRRHERRRRRRPDRRADPPPAARRPRTSRPPPRPPRRPTDRGPTPSPRRSRSTRTTTSAATSRRSRAS